MLRAVVRPLRSVLYVPASNVKALQKARSLPCDALILDLEDAVAPSAKEAARKNIIDVLREGAFSANVAIRVNAASTPFYEADLATVAEATRITAAAGDTASPIACVLPKVEEEGQLADARSGLEAQRAVVEGTTIWAMIETPLGVLHCPQLAADAAKSVDFPLSALVAGTSDLTADLRAQHTPDRLPMLHALSTIVTAARAFGISALDGVHLDVSGPTAAATFAAHCAQGRALGFDGKTVIHPSQVGPSNAAFGPTPQEIARAQTIVASAEAAQGALVVVEGRLVEALHVREAQRILALAQAIQAREGQQQQPPPAASKPA